MGQFTWQNPLSIKLASVSWEILQGIAFFLMIFIQSGFLKLIASSKGKVSSTGQGVTSECVCAP